MRTLAGSLLVVLGWAFGMTSTCAVLVYAGVVVVWMHAPVFLTLAVAMLALFICLKISLAINDWGRGIKNRFDKSWPMR